MGKKDIIYIGLLVAILAALLTLVLRTEVQANENEIVETTEICSVVETTIEEPTTEIPLTTVKHEDVPNYRDLGTYKLTAYCSCSKCCGKSDGITASGTKPKANHTVAVDPSVIPLGTELYIGGTYYTAEDTGGAIKGNRIDICVDSHEEALRLGTGYVKVYEVVG